ncbi:MAG: hypothetical protein ACTSVG_11905 [Alphaproteobacteria bacterium]
MQATTLCDLLAQIEKTLAPKGKKVIFRFSFPRMVRPKANWGAHRRAIVPDDRTRIVRGKNKYPGLRIGRSDYPGELTED